MYPPSASGTGTSTGRAGNGDMTSELESFRLQWRAEVSAKKNPQSETALPPLQHPPLQHRSKASDGVLPASLAGLSAVPPVMSASMPLPQQPPRQSLLIRSGPGSGDSNTNGTASGSGGGGSASRTIPAPTSVQTPMRLLSAGKKPIPPDREDDGYYVTPQTFGDTDDDNKDNCTPSSGHTPTANASYEPCSALEHYEKAVEREAQGSLGDSLRLYRKAFRMDSTVDKQYKNKHFPTITRDASACASPPTAAEPPAVDRTPAPAPAPPPTFQERIASYAGLGIEGAPSPVDGMPAPPCPLATLPDELLVQVLCDVAVADVGDFVRLALVCRKLAFLVATEDQIWRRVCIDAETGFAHMHWTWKRAIAWDALADVDDVQAQKTSLATTLALRGLGTPRDPVTTEPPYTSWQHMFRLRPRIRFNGCYISTVNYIRSGQASVNLVSWNSPVHIVTYFRYLRFFRDGTAISLVTTAEPADVVHHLTKELLALHAGGVMVHLPSAVMQSALKGRWRLSAVGDTCTDGPTASAATDAPSTLFTSLAAATEAEGDLVVETEGVGKYYYRMELSMRTAGKGTRNNKLVWRGFYSYDRLTDDWGEFCLKNDRPFLFSRVKSYGMGA